MTFDEFASLMSENMGIERESIKRETSLIYDLGIDSLSVVNFIVKMEKKYQIKFDMGKLWDMRNVGEIYDLIVGKMAKIGEIRK